MGDGLGDARLVKGTGAGGLDEIAGKPGIASRGRGKARRKDGEDGEDPDDKKKREATLPWHLSVHGALSGCGQRGARWCGDGRAVRPSPSAPRWRHGAHAATTGREARCASSGPAWC